MEGEDDLEFLPHLNYLGQSQLTVGPVEVGGKVTANCRQSGYVLDPAVVVLDTGAPVASILVPILQPDTRELLMEPVLTTFMALTALSLVTCWSSAIL